MKLKFCKPVYLKMVTHIQFFSVNPVVFRELDVKLDVEVSLLKGVSVLWHSLSLHHSNTTCHTYTSSKESKDMHKQYKYYDTIRIREDTI